MRLDVVMWARNGEATLPQVLGRLEKSLPAEPVHRKILVDDHSTELLLNDSTGRFTGMRKEELRPA